MWTALFLALVGLAGNLVAKAAALQYFLIYTFAVAMLMMAMFQRTFLLAVSFSQDLSAWDTRSALYMFATFKSATAFDSNLAGWDVSQVTDTSSMFQ